MYAYITQFFEKQICIDSAISRPVYTAHVPSNLSNIVFQKWVPIKHIDLSQQREEKELVQTFLEMYLIGLLDMSSHVFHIHQNNINSQSTIVITYVEK